MVEQQVQGGDGEPGHRPGVDAVDRQRFGGDVDRLYVKTTYVDEGPTLRRYRPRALGRATRINKRTSHIAVALSPEED